jgi:hypothetical protein
MECRKEFFKNKRHKRGQHRGEACFILVFPLDVEFPDETVVTMNNRLDLKEQIRAWKKDNRGAEERPTIVFPIDVEYADGTRVPVASSDELKALKESCAEADEG